MGTRLQNKLLNFAPEPPKRIWDAIATTLNGEAPTLSQKLYAFETSPPSGIWDKIDQQLDASTQPVVKVIPFYRLHKKAIRYAAAAIFLVAALTSGFLMNRKNKTVALSTIPLPATAHQEKEETKPTIEVDQSQSTALYSQDREYKSGFQSNPLEERKVFLKRLRPHLQLGSMVLATRFMPKVAPTKQTVDEGIPAEKYMIYSDGNGTALKLSKKLFDFFSCAKEELPCQQQMQQLQQQFASTSFSTDFTAVLEMLGKLKEKQ